MTNEEAKVFMLQFNTDKRLNSSEHEAVRMAIKALEQEPQTDEIILSKKEYRELLSDEFEHGYDKGLSDAITSLEQEPCNDAISRQAAIDCLNADFTIDGKENMETVVDYINGAFKQIKALPSVTPKPKVGKWIRIDKDKLKCSVCEVIHYIAQYPQSANINYCPNCGTKMEEEEC